MKRTDGQPKNRNGVVKAFVVTLTTGKWTPVPDHIPYNSLKSSGRRYTGLMTVVRPHKGQYHAICLPPFKT